MHIPEDVDDDPKLSLWRYDADLNQWGKKDYYPGYSIQRFKAASLNSFACIGLGMTGNFWAAELWMYK
jgi:hypothetical protein